MDDEKKSLDILKARYSYSVWLRHLVLAKKNNPSFKVPEIVVELGPGDSLGVGLAALLSGAKKIYALDIVQHTEPSQNIKIFEELLKLFSNRESIPDNQEWPKLRPYIDNYSFPNAFLTDEHMEESLSDRRIDEIKKILRNLRLNVENEYIQYYVPWTQSKKIDDESCDMILSQSVLEYIDNLDQLYASMAKWLKPGGLISHEIDLSSLGNTNKWNGHWKYSDFIWNLKSKFFRRRPYSINRQPYSGYVRLTNTNNFTIIGEVPYTDISGIKRNEINKKYSNLSDKDLITRSIFIQAVKNQHNVRLKRY